jgi:hypothetical protein
MPNQPRYTSARQFDGRSKEGRQAGEERGGKGGGGTYIVDGSFGLGGDEPGRVGVDLGEGGRGEGAESGDALGRERHRAMG